jgi:hypothetical protein
MMPIPPLSLAIMLQGLVAVALLILFVWLAFYVLLVVLVLGALGAVGYGILRALRHFGIIRAQASPPTDEAHMPPTLEGDYQDITETPQKDASDEPR